MTNDLISRSKVEEVISALVHEEGVTDDAAVLGCMVWNAVHTMKAVDAAPVVHGRWIHCAGKSNVWHCSECGGRIMYNQTRKTYNIKKPPVSEANKFCKHCGARMDKEYV